MKRLLQFALLLALAGTGLPAFAQHVARVPRGQFKIASAPAGTRVMTAAEAHQAGVITTGAANVVAAGDGATVRSLLEGNLPVPGLGFDYPHLAAINRNLETRALIDPVTQQRLALARAIRRETPAVGFAPAFFPSSPVIIVQSAPPVIVLQQEGDERSSAFAPRAERVSAAAREAEPVAEAPVARVVEPHKVLEEYVLVRKDGSVIHMVAFSAHDGRITYVTREGLRRSIALTDLDRDATLQRNEALGAEIKLPG